MCIVFTPERVSNWLGLYNGEPVIFQSFVAFPYRDEALVSLQMNPHELRNAIMKFITQGLTDAGFNWRIAYYDNAIGDFGSFPAFHLRIRWGTNPVLA